MIEFKFKHYGYDGSVSVTHPDSIQRLSDHFSSANRKYILDELILMVVRKDNQQLSMNYPDYTPVQVAELNNLSDITISLGDARFQRIVWLTLANILMYKLCIGGVDNLSPFTKTNCPIVFQVIEGISFPIPIDE